MFNYVSVFLFFMIIVSLGAYILYSGWGAKPNWSNACRGVWVSPFECGFVGHGYSENVFSYTLLNLMVVFIIFDVEISLLLNMVYYDKNFDNYFLYLVFVIIMGLGYVVELELGYISWVY